MAGWKMEIRYREQGGRCQKVKAGKGDGVNPSWILATFIRRR